MFRTALMAGVAASLLAFSQPASAQQEYPATLTGHAVLPAGSFLPAPADAPADLKTSGKYTTAKRVDAPGSVMGKSYERETGVKLPFEPRLRGNQIVLDCVALPLRLFAHARRVNIDSQTSTLTDKIGRMRRPRRRHGAGRRLTFKI